jgi:hypothetical protein
MNKDPMRFAARFCAVVVLLGGAYWLIAASGAHPVRASVIDAGNSILSDGKGDYLDGVNGEARIWDFDPPAIDHLYFEVSSVNNSQKRKLKLSIPGITSGVETCEAGRLQPNQNSHAYSFYDQLGVGQSTADIGENFWGTFRCYDKSGKTGYTVTYDSVTPCIVITHGQYGNSGSNPLEWTHAADGSCKARIEKFVNRRLVGTWVDQSAPFQIVATELP